MASALIALGGNVGDVRAAFSSAIALVCEKAAARLAARSSDYTTPPWGNAQQPSFVNACIAIKTDVPVRELLARCQAVENDMARVRTRRWGPRNIDVDILTFRDQKIDEADLVVPHPRIAERAFVLVPLKDIAPDLTIGGASLDQMLSELDASDVQPLAE